MRNATIAASLLMLVAGVMLLAPLGCIQSDEPVAVAPFPGARRRLQVFHKVAPTPARYPRRPGRAAKRPLGGVRA